MYKKGEKEAREILERKGIKFDNSYYDDNVGESKADLRYENGRFLEVTHTRHNNSIYYSPNKFSKKQLNEKMQLLHKVNNAYDRIKKLDYIKSDGKITADGVKKFKADCQLIKNYSGCNVSSTGVEYDEFKCDAPTMQYSADNIIKEIIDDKAPKYPNGGTDLFIFVTEEEYGIFDEMLKETSCNRYSENCINKIIKSPFQNIYICIWDNRNNRYEINTPVMMKLTKNKDLIEVKVYDDKK